MVTDIENKEKARKSELKSIVIDFPGLVAGVNKGNIILIQDGLMKLEVLESKGSYLEAKVIDGGIVRNHKGVNIPNSDLKYEALTEKDKEDLKFILKEGVEYIALSFVSSGEDIVNLKKEISQKGVKQYEVPQVVAKIERREAIKNFDDILKQTDAVMVARGDLGMEMEETKVAVYQKEIVEKSLRNAKPVIVATQMLGSMIRKPRPTRAEVSDVSNAVVDHADAVMLSEETAIGKYPVRAVEIMNDIIKKTEESPFDDLVHGFLGDAKSSISAAVAQAAHELSKDSGSGAIIVASLSGFTARMIARHRPQQRIYVMTNSKVTHQQLSLLWGTESFILPDCKTLDDLIANSIETLKNRKLVKKGKKVVIVTGRPHVKREHMSLVKVEEIR
jgi:pyruvate kinase